jgi:hypothetical protein
VKLTITRVAVSADVSDVPDLRDSTGRYATPGRIGVIAPHGDWPTVVDVYDTDGYVIRSWGRSDASQLADAPQWVQEAAAQLLAEVTR